MKVLKRIFLVITVVLVIIVLRGPLFRFSVSYLPTGQRAGYEISNDKLRQYIRQNQLDKDSADIQEIIKTSLALTSNTLDFTFSKKDENPNRLIDSKLANCIGYAAFFSAVCNYQLKEYDLSEEWGAIRKVGQLSVFGMNIHHFIEDPFFKDHDFVVIQNKVTDESYAVDPSMYDYLYIDFITLKDDIKK